MSEQMNIFECLYPTYKVKGKTRLIELFAGYGSQALSLKYLGIPFEHWKTAEWNYKSCHAYKKIHMGDDNKDYSKGLSKEELISYLAEKGISSNWNTPMKLEQIKRLNEVNLREIYNDIQASHNLVDISQVCAKDLEIINRDQYTYVLTYSFPCQDLSLAGLREGMDKESGSRSSLLWQVERILHECKELDCLPQVLLMENVIQVHGVGNEENWRSWLLELEKLGYSNYWQDLIATDYGIPQIRNRTFCLSILGEYNYSFPQPIELKKKLKDLLEKNVGEKFYLSEKALNGIAKTTFGQHKLENRLPKNDCAPTIMARDYKDPQLIIEGEPQALNTFNKILRNDGLSNVINTRVSASNHDYILIKNATKQGYLEATEGDGVDISSRMQYHRGTVQKDLAQTIQTECSGGVVIKSVTDENLKEKLCNDLITNEKVKENDVIRHNYSSSRINGEMKDIKQNNLSPTLDTRCDCLGVVVKDVYQIKPAHGYFNGEIKKTDQLSTIDTGISNWHLLIGEKNKTHIENNLRIRKLTPKECFRLQGVKDEDYEKLEMSNSVLYHLAGDSICVTVLMAIFGELYGFEWKEKVERLHG